MIIKLPKNVFDYFQNERKLVISVNKISEYLSLNILKKINLKLNFENEQLIDVDVDEKEIDNELLKDHTLFILITLYAMAIGE